MSFEVAHLLFDASNFQTEINKLFLLGKPSGVVSAWNEKKGCDRTCANSTRPSSAVADNRLRQAERTAYSRSCCDDWAPMGGSSDLVRERHVGGLVPWLPPMWGEMLHRFCKLPGGR
jgi:hypothetical protein